MNKVPKKKCDHCKKAFFYEDSHHISVIDYRIKKDSPILHYHKNCYEEVRSELPVMLRMSASDSKFKEV